MKLKTLLIITLAASAANAGFFSHDKAYYDKHIDVAKENFLNIIRYNIS